MTTAPIAPNVILTGGTGTGKTHSLRTLPFETFIFFTEPGMEVVETKSCKEGLHYHYISPRKLDFASLKDTAKKINMLSFRDLTNLPDINKRKSNEWISLLESLEHPVCQRCGQEFPNIGDWDPRKRALAIDSLSGLNLMAMSLVVGTKPVRSQGEWGVAMNLLEQFIQMLCVSIPCAFILTAHAEREIDQTTGAVQLYPSALGNKLSPKITRFFSDAILTVREGTSFVWSNVAQNADVKARNLPPSAKNPPSFVPLFKNWKETD